MLVEYPVVADNLSFTVGFGKKIIRNISLVLRKTEFVGLIGGSGSGKTTLMTCINGFQQPTGGRVRLNGIPGEEKEKVRHLIGYVPQEDLVHTTLRVQSALYYAMLLRSPENIDTQAVTSRVSEVLELLDLTDHKNTKISSLSGGQRKRVNIGLELLHSPELFFLDEPTAGLDPGLEHQLMKFLSELADENRMIMLTTHLMQNVDLFDVLIYIHKGYMIYFGPSTAIIEYFKVKNMVEVFDKVAQSNPEMLAIEYGNSRVYASFLQPRFLLSKTLSIKVGAGV